MRKKAYLIGNLIWIFMFIFCQFFNTSYALTEGTVYLSTNKGMLEKGGEIEITLSIENAKVVAFSSSLYFDNSKLEYVSGPENVNIVENRIILVWYDLEGGSNPKEGELAKFKFTAKEDGFATFNIDGEFYSSKGQLIQTNFKEIQVQIVKEQTKLEKETEEQGTNSQSDNATLQVLRLNKEGITPNFDKEIHEYYITIPNSINDIEVIAISENPNATIEIIGNTNLKQGINLIIIKVISEDKTQNKIYTIQVTKTDDLELANTNLEILAIENTLLYPPFESNVTHYKVDISDEITNLNVLAVPENEKAIVKIAGDTGLNEGNNLITVTVTAQNRFSQKIYEVNVYKRNQEEEKKYKEEQEESKEKLEEIYQTEKINSQIEEEKNETDKKSKNQNQVIWSVGIILIIISLLIFIIYKKRIK